MDIMRSSANAPLPPAPRVRSHVAAQQPTALLLQLAALSEPIGAAPVIKVLSGSLPSVDVPVAKIVAVATYLRDQLGFDLLSCIAGVDMVDHLEVVYHVRSLANNWLVQLKVALPPGTHEVESLIGIWITANWLERETFDLFGIVFASHPDLRRILLDDEFEGFPLLKSFRQTPMTVHDQATTQVSGEIAVAGEAERGLGNQRAVAKLLSQGEQERLHPGTPTFGSTQFHGRDFPPTTWKHTLEHAAAAEADDKKKK